MCNIRLIVLLFDALSVIDNMEMMMKESALIQACISYQTSPTRTLTHK